MMALRSLLFALLALASAAPASAQYVADYPRPVLVDPAWFAGVTPVDTRLPIQDCEKDRTQACVMSGSGTWFLRADFYIGPAPVPLDKKRMALFQRAEKNGSLDQYQRLLRDLAYLRAQQFGLFFADINDQLKVYYSSEDALMMRGETLAMLGRYDLAIKDIDAALFWSLQRKNKNRLAFIYSARAEVLARLGRAQEAGLALEQADFTRFKLLEDVSGQNYRIDLASDFVPRAAFGWTRGQRSRIDEAVNAPLATNCMPVPAEIVAAQKVGYRNVASYQWTTHNAELCGDWKTVIAHSGYLMDEAIGRPSQLGSDAKVALFYRAASQNARAQVKLGNYKEAQRLWYTMMVAEGPTQRAKAFEQQLGSTILEGRSKGVTAEPYIMSGLVERINYRKSEWDWQPVPGPNHVLFQVCNQTSDYVELAIEYEEQQGRRVTTAWHELNGRNTCKNFYVIAGSKVRYRARYFETNEHLAGAWEGDVDICVPGSSKGDHWRSTDQTVPCHPLNRTKAIETTVLQAKSVDLKHH